MKTLYIHIGTQKTGTTSLQNFLEDNQEELLKHGVYYPLNLGHWVPPESGEWVGVGNFHPIWRHFWERDDLTEKTAQDLRNTFLVADTVLLSTECLWTGEPITDPIPTNAPFFYKNLKEALPETIIKIIVYLRPQIDYLESVHKQRVQSDKISKTLQYIYYDSDSYEAQLHYYDRLCEVGAEIGFENIIVRIYDKAEFQGGNIFADFLSIFNLPLTDSYRSSYAFNPTLSDDFIECIRRISLTESMSLEEYWRVFYQWATREGIAKLRTEGCPPRLSCYTSEQRKAFMERFCDENRKLAQRFLHRDTLFYQEFYGESGAKPVEEPEVLTAAIRIFTAAIVELNRKYDRQRQSIDESQSKIDELNRKYSEQQREINEFQSKIGELKQKYNEQLQKTDEINRRYSEQQREFDDLRSLGRIRLKIAALRLKLKQIFRPNER